jgi:hypothetical protein
MRLFVKYCITLLIFLGSFSAQGASKNKETYEYLDLFGQIFDRVRSEYVEEVTDQEVNRKSNRWHVNRPRSPFWLYE